jgi:hypothetical protein
MHTESSGYFESQIEPRVKFADGKLYLPGNPGVTDHSHAVIVRKIKGGRIYFYAAGFDGPGTLAASHYLTDHWQELERKWPKQSFYVLVQRDASQSAVVEITSGPLPD